MFAQSYICNAPHILSTSLAQSQLDKLNLLDRPSITALDLFRAAFGEPDPWQYDTLTCGADRILLNCARQSGKSTVTAPLAVADILTIPHALVLLLSPTLRQSTELFNKCLHVYHTATGVPAPLYENKLSLGLANGSRLLSLPGKPETVRGFSAVTRLIIDECAFVGDPLYKAVRPMLAVSRGKLALMSTPFGQRGFFHEEYTRRERWFYREVPATLNPRISQEFLDEERASLGPLYEQEYECSFLTGQIGLFSLEAIQSALDNGEELWL